MQPLKWLTALAFALAASDLGNLPPEKFLYFRLQHALTLLMYE
jgi:hypothetical protein